MSKAAQIPDALDPDRIKSHLKTSRIGKKVVVYNSTASTNDIAGEYAKNKGNDGLVVLAEEQTQGRGRSGNRWVSRRGDSILCSILLTESSLGAELLPLTMAVAVAEAIGKCAKSDAQIKWPNDIILNCKKVAGILVESRRHGRHIYYVIGIGINCHQRKGDFPAELQKTATSIDIETDRFTDRISLIRRLLTSVDHWIETAEAGREQVIERWRRLSTQLGHRVSVIYNKKKFSGNCIGIDPDKGLVLQLDTGSTRFFHASHTTVVKESADK